MSVQVINGSNEFLKAIGDMDTKRTVKIINASWFERYEPMTGLTIKPNASIEFELIGDIAFATLSNNIKQMNLGAGFEAFKLEVNASDVTDEPSKPTLINCTYDETSQTFTYTGGEILLHFNGNEIRAEGAVATMLNEHDAFNLQLNISNPQNAVFIVLTDIADYATAYESITDSNFVGVLLTKDHDSNSISYHGDIGGDQSLKWVLLDELDKLTFNNMPMSNAKIIDTIKKDGTDSGMGSLYTSSKLKYIHVFMIDRNGEINDNDSIMLKLTDL